VSLLAEKLSRYFGYRKVDKKLFLPPPRTPWNALPFSSQITSTSLQLDGNNNEVQFRNSNRVDDENDLILTIDFFFSSAGDLFRQLAFISLNNTWSYLADQQRLESISSITSSSSSGKMPSSGCIRVSRIIRRLEPTS